MLADVEKRSIFAIPKHTDMTNYTTYQQVIKGNLFQIMVVTGKYNYISVTKKTNNPFGGKIGKDFKSFDEAVASYKSGEMKAFLLQVEMNLLEPVRTTEVA